MDQHPHQPADIAVAAGDAATDQAHPADRTPALPAEQAEVIALSFFSQSPQTEIARALGIPLGTVKSRVRLAMNRLRHLLDETS